jgi:transposase-like protein
VIDETTKERAISMLKLGYSVAEIEEELGISRPTLYRYKKIIK